MEADGNSAPACEYCALTGHQSDQCKERRFDRRLDGAIGCVGTILLAPFAALGWATGCFVSGFQAGFSKGFEAGAWVRDRIDRWRRG